MLLIPKSEYQCGNKYEGTIIIIYLKRTVEKLVLCEEECRESKREFAEPCLSNTVTEDLGRSHKNISLNKSMMMS